MKKQEKYEILQGFISDRTQVYKFFRDLYYALPTKDILELIESFNTGENNELLQWEELISKLAKSLQQNTTKDILGELRAEFTFLFIGPKSPPASLFESVYLSPRRHLFDKVTQQVRQEYSKYNLQVERKDSIPDDHIAYELEFLYFLSSKIEELIAKNRPIKEVKELLQDSRDFLGNHPLKWVEAFSQNVDKAATYDFYKLSTKALVEFLKYDLEVVNELVASL